VFMQRNVAYLLLIIMLGLIALGLVMLSSTSAVLAPLDMTGVYSNLRKQLVWLALGGIVCVFLSRYDYQKLLRTRLDARHRLRDAGPLPDSAYRCEGERFAPLAAAGGWTYQPSSSRSWR